MRVVVDTNVFVSALLSSQGVPSQLFRYWELRYFDLLISEKSMEELARVLHYPKVRKGIHSTDAELAEYVRLFKKRGVLITSQETIRAIPADVSDNIYLEIAVAGEADYIVSGDKHLLKLQEYRGIAILTPVAFLDTLTSVLADE
jgi:putative PIN family toxin of toxin-antitoxin system